MESLFNKFYYKETPTQVFSWEYCETFKNTYCEEHLRTTASVDRKRVGKVGYTTKVRRSHVIGRYSGKLLFENRDLNISLNFSTLLVKLQLWIGKWNKGFELFKLTFLNLFFSFPEKKWDHSKLKTANFPVVIFCKDKDRAYLTGACISKSLFHIQQEIWLVFNEGKVKSLISSSLMKKHIRLNSFRTYNWWIRQCPIHSPCAALDRDSGDAHIHHSILWNVEFHACTE